MRLPNSYGSFTMPGTIPSRSSIAEMRIMRAADCGCLLLTCSMNW